MKTTRRQFLQTSAFASLAAAQPILSATPSESAKQLPFSGAPLDAFAIAAQHLIASEIPGPTFFEGMLLGNGDIGACVVVRPDALILHLAKSDCWDIRVSEEGNNDVVPFADILQMWQRASDAAKREGKPDMLNIESGVGLFRGYTERVGVSYTKRWPRPWPCGTLWLKWDPRWVEPGRYTLNPANGLFTLELRLTSLNGAIRTSQLSAMVDWESGLVTIQSCESIPLESIIYSPQVDKFHAESLGTENADVHLEQLPSPDVSYNTRQTFSEFSCYQYFPAVAPTKERPISPKSDKDRNFSLQGRIADQWTATRTGIAKDIYFSPKDHWPLRLDVFIATPRDLLLKRLEDQNTMTEEENPWVSIPQTHVYSQEDLDTLSYAKGKIAVLSGKSFSELQKASELRWREHWSRSAVAFKDKDLERIWYHNQYFLACCLRKNKTAPGLFANWITESIGIAWHSDYHMDYNCEQVYWGVFSSNHVDMHGPYVELCENLMPMSEQFARDSFNLPGAFFPLSAYPVPSQIVPYPVPPWGYQICMTPWAVQSLWWQFLYTQDEDYLRRVYPMMRAAARFLAAYVKKEDDGRYHIFPSVSSENWGFTVDYRLNKDCILDLALTQFLLDAMVTASITLGVDIDERARWREIRDNLASYPKAQGPYGEVWLDIIDAPVGHIYNVPITLAPVFPGEQVGIGKGQEYLEIATRTARTIQLEGGNDLVSQPLIRARLGMLDLVWFKRQVQYCTLPDGVSNDRVRQSGGRYGLSTDFDFMMHMGLWCENFALPAVLNECMLQSYAGVIRLFPNTENLGATQFANLRAAGAFLVSAAYDGHAVTQVMVLSEKGKTLRIVSPWEGRMVHAIRIRDGREIAAEMEGPVFAIETNAGEMYSISPS